MSTSDTRQDRNVDGDTDYNACSIPTTHRRLVDAHVLWHQSLDSYRDPERFRANLNASLQALRNITFALQGEKAAFGDFDKWYEPWQTRLAADPLATWVKDSRNRVVKQGELETNSTAVVRLLTWKDDVLAQVEIPPLTPDSLLLDNVPLVKLVSEAKIPPGDVADGAVAIERRWSIPELDGREVLDALAHVYGMLSELVLDAHLHLGCSACIASPGGHSHFVSKYHRTGVLECMAIAVEHRTSRFTPGGDVLAPTSMAPTSRVTLSDAAARYGMSHGDRTADWEKADPLLVAERVLFQAKRTLRRDRCHARIIFIRDGAGRWHQLGFVARDRTEKHLIIRMVAAFVERVGADALIDVGELWTLSEEQARTLTTLSSIENVPGRGEALQVLVATREGMVKAFDTPFTRGPFGGIRLQDTIVVESHTLYYLQPIVDVWRRQGITKNRRGENVRWLWEPDALDDCFCGSSLRFADCCKPLIGEPGKHAELQKRFEAAIASGDSREAEKYASAALAQYVIWVKQHTAPTRHVAEALHRGFVELDIPALETHLRQLEEALEASGRLEDFVGRLQHISRVIGVPELSVRVTALAASHALRTGDRAGAVAQLERLGDLDRVQDTLAFLVAARAFAGNRLDERSFLNNAVSSARSEGERFFAELQLARYLIRNGDVTQGLGIVDRLVEGARGKNEMEGLVADALVLRWQGKQGEDDFVAAKLALEVMSDSEHRRDLAVLLIQHGDYAEATHLLESADSRDLTAAFLRIEILLRSNEPQKAKEEFQQIAADKIPSNLRHPYIHTQWRTSHWLRRMSACKGLLLRTSRHYNPLAQRWRWSRS
jgi:hypothetical protein